jgi:hypothetical protein
MMIPDCLQLVHWVKEAKWPLGSNRAYILCKGLSQVTQR